ncbi:hypothetical protein [Roseibium alexandrii]|jgi:hypothetical protein|uniref:Uncharacterized protein n=1 Tax=Roseibium alexandrii (strain DSM 17067 / NCIMB 14079 / DFL-11) TaxID=244592 RepID=A0A5E8GUS8_ROSAD|nr:hypothetical protein [Roseibium alexandrii]EEE43616.2 hypothetical protein SADFL11_902 [Roseibium alexandrii DFL-11]
MVSRDVFIDQPQAFDGPVVEAASFLGRVQRYLDMAQFRDVAVDLADGRLFILSESRFEDLIVYGQHPLAWLIDISSYPTHSTRFGTSIEDLENLISHWCGSIIDQTGRPHIVLDAWMYDQFRQKQTIMLASAQKSALKAWSGADRSPQVPKPDRTSTLICLETFRKTGLRRPPTLPRDDPRFELP